MFMHSVGCSKGYVFLASFHIFCILFGYILDLRECGKFLLVVMVFSVLWRFLVSLCNLHVSDFSVLCKICYNIYLAILISMFLLCFFTK
jgi:hypothetical protein